MIEWLEDKSDWLSPIVVKEVRQIVRSREFAFSFGGSLVAAFAVAFYGAANALGNANTTGAGTFVALMVCLTLLGMLVVPIGAFSALRNERMEQTLELVTVTALSPRRVVIGKLMAQAVKLVTLFAAMAPFIAMSFLLGGIDFVTILVSLGVLFFWSVWASAAFLFLSTLFKSRAMSGVVFGVVGIVAMFIFTMIRVPFFLLRGSFAIAGATGGRSAFWWTLAMVMSGCVMTTINLVLLGENRLSVETENRVTPLRVGFFAQLLLIIGWGLTYLGEPAWSRESAAQALGVIGGLHLAFGAMFTLPEDLHLPRRVLLQLRQPSRWGWRVVFFRPGGGRGAAYLLLQMLLLLAATSLLSPSAMTMRWLFAICGYICLFAGVPTLAWRVARPESQQSFRLRAALLVVLMLALVLPDILYYLVKHPVTFDVVFGERHLVNPFRTLANWSTVEVSGWLSAPLVLGMSGLVACLGLILQGARVTAQQDVAATQVSPAADGESPSVDAVY